MTFDERSNTLKMKPTKEGEHYLNLKLEDEDGETAEEQLYIKFEYSKVIEEEIKIIKTEI